MRDIITNIYRILLELLHDVRHRALVYALEPVEVVGLAVACAFFLVCGRGDGVRRGAASGRAATRDSRFGRRCRTRALLLDAISAGQVVLEHVRAARFAGLRMVVCERLFLRSGARRAANCGNAWFRGPRISGRDAQRFHACAALPPNRTRRLTFLKAGRGHTTSSSSAITIAKWTSEAVQSLISHETASTCTPCPARARRT